MGVRSAALFLSHLFHRLNKVVFYRHLVALVFYLSGSRVGEVSLSIPEILQMLSRTERLFVLFYGLCFYTLLCCLSFVPCSGSYCKLNLLKNSLTSFLTSVLFLPPVFLLTLICCFCCCCYCVFPKSFLWLFYSI